MRKIQNEFEKSKKYLYDEKQHITVAMSVTKKTMMEQLQWQQLEQL
jgi:hypothetical protein